MRRPATVGRSGRDWGNSSRWAEAVTNKFRTAKMPDRTADKLFPDIEQSYYRCSEASPRCGLFGKHLADLRS